MSTIKFTDLFSQAGKADPDNAAFKKAAPTDDKTKIETCKAIISNLDEKLIPSAADDERTVVCYTLSASSGPCDVLQLIV